MTLLEKAKQTAAVKRGRPITGDVDERLELALAYARHEIECSQAATVLGMKTSNVTNVLALSIFTAIRNGKLEVIVK